VQLDNVSLLTDKLGYLDNDVVVAKNVSLLNAAVGWYVPSHYWQGLCFIINDSIQLISNSGIADLDDSNSNRSVNTRNILEAAAEHNSSRSSSSSNCNSCNSIRGSNSKTYIENGEDRSGEIKQESGEE
jgi:hypothetical protein